jgi:hypothetical protein
MIVIILCGGKAGIIMVVGLCGHLEGSSVRAEGWRLCGPDGV